MLDVLKKIFRKVKRLFGKTEIKKPEGKKRELPSQVVTLLEEAGLKTKDFKFFIKSDMDSEGCYCTAWISVDEQGLYIALGNEEIIKKRGNKKIETKYTIDEIRSYPIKDIEKLKTEQYVSTGRLIAVENDEDIGLVKFSISFLSDFDNLCKVFDGLKKNDLEPLKHIDTKKEHTCPKCGTPYPLNRNVCPKCIEKSSTVKRLLKFFGGYKSKIVVIVIAILINSSISMLIPQLGTKTLFDEILNKVGTTDSAILISSLATLVLSIFGIKLISLVMNIAFQYMMGSIMPRVIYDIKLKIFSAMQRLSVGFYSSKQTGSLMERVVRDSNNIYWFFVDGVPYVITNIITLLGVIIIMFTMSWKLTLLMSIAVPVFFLLLSVGSKFFRVLHHSSWSHNAKLTSMVSDNINGQRIIKAFSKENEEFKRFDRINENLLKADLKLKNSEATIFPLLTVLLSLLATLILTVGGLMVTTGELSVGTLLSFTVYLTMLVGPVDFLSWVSNWWARCVDSAQRVFEIVDAEPDVVEKSEPIEIGDIRGDVEISELEFEYEPAHPVIKKLNLKVEAGQMLGIVGKTGAGKTTIANLITRLYDPKQGCVKIDGIDVRDLSFSKIRSNVGLVSQDIYLFIGTIADNIRYAKPDATMDEVIAAAKAASAHDFIMKLPDAYETRVGAGGQNLSGGERQRISIARTIIQNPRILILDEATAAMDTETERNIQYSLTELMQGRTTIAIAHRLSTLRDADMLAVIDDGTIVEYGSYVDLLRKKGEFYKLYKIQSEALKAVGIID